MNFNEAIERVAKLHGVHGREDVEDLKNDVFLEWLESKVTPKVLRLMGRHARRMAHGYVSQEMMLRAFCMKKSCSESNHRMDAETFRELLEGMPEPEQNVAEMLSVCSVKQTRKAFKMNGVAFRKIRDSIRKRVEAWRGWDA
jgi:hypothetical protein